MSPPKYSLTIESSKMPCPRCQTHPLCYYFALATCLSSLADCQRVTFKLAALVYRSLHKTFHTYMSSVLHAYTPTQSLRSFSAHLLVEPRLRNTRFSWLPNCRTTNLELSIKSHQTCSLFLLVQIQTQNLPYYFNSLISGRLVNSPRI